MELTDKFMVVDTETTNSIDDPIVYDIGFIVTDGLGNVYERKSYVVAEIFLDEDLMASAYFKEKVPMYWEQIKKGERELKRFYNIRKAFSEIVRKYDIKIISAHNARFDYHSLNLTQRFLTSSKYRYFFPYGIEIWDTLKMARAILKDSDEYREFCEANDFLTSTLQNKYTAEVLYKFITNDLDFEEAHTGLEDTLIEKDIFTFCLQNDPLIDGKLWA